jgi:hypothetical protein
MYLDHYVGDAYTGIPVPVKTQRERIHAELERIVEAYKDATDAEERRAVLRKMRRLIEEADHLDAPRD